MNTLIFTHPACFDHDPGFGHPENADRLRAILATLEAESFCLLDRREAPRATVDQSARAHPRRYVERILEMVPEHGYVDLDADTVVSPGSGEAALRAAGAVVGAMHARAAHGVKRVAAVDFDVHHGNGTQDIFWKDPDLFYASTHQYPLYPGTGHARETGVANNILNVPLRPMSASPEFRQAFTAQILPALEAFEPELIMISAGFDGHSHDPLASLDLTEA